MHGAWALSDTVRSDFANDSRNLFAVDDGTNREKGAKGPLEWLPPSGDFACQYASRFWRVVLIYGLVVEEPEAKAMQKQRAILCGSGQLAALPHPEYFLKAFTGAKVHSVWMKSSASPLFMN